MKIKFLGFIAALLVVLLPTGVFAYTDGYTEKRDIQLVVMKLTAGKYSQEAVATELTDNDLSTYYLFKAGEKYQVPANTSEMEIKSFYINSSDIEALNIYVNTITGGIRLLEKEQIVNGYNNIESDEVITGIRIFMAPESHDVKVYEMEFYGEFKENGAITTPGSNIITTPEPNDYNNGLLDQPNLIKNTSLPLESFDNDLETSERANDGWFIEFNSPVDLTGMYVNKSGPYFMYVYYYDGDGNQNKQSISSAVSERYVDLSYNNVYKITFQNGSTTTPTVYELDFFGSYDSKEIIINPGEPGDKTAPDEVGNIEATTTEDSATITYSNPNDIDFSHVNVYLEGKTYKGSNGQVYISNLAPKTTYAAVIKTVDTLGNESAGKTVEFTTKEKPVTPPTTPDEVPEVKNLQMETDGERVDLSWENPPQFFDKATIYRKDLGQATAASFNWNPFAPMVASANSGFKPLFETNGTEFSDLTIDPENEYEYLVTNTYNGMESNGVTVAVTVPKPPLISTEDVEMPFGVGELIKSGNGLLALIGGFILLALAFVLVPKVIALIRNSNTGKPGTAAPGRMPREAKQPRITDRQMNMAMSGGRAAREGRQPRLTKRQMKGV